MIRVCDLCLCRLCRLSPHLAEPKIFEGRQFWVFDWDKWRPPNCRPYHSRNIPLSARSPRFLWSESKPAKHENRTDNQMLLRSNNTDKCIPHLLLLHVTREKSMLPDNNTHCLIKGRIHNAEKTLFNWLNRNWDWISSLPKFVQVKGSFANKDSVDSCPVPRVWIIFDYIFAPWFRERFPCLIEEMLPLTLLGVATGTSE